MDEDEAWAFGDGLVIVVAVNKVLAYFTRGRVDNDDEGDKEGDRDGVRVVDDEARALSLGKCLNDCMVTVLVMVNGER